MIDREKVIEGFEMSYRYSNVDDDNTLVPQRLVLDALALLKAQEPPKNASISSAIECLLHPQDTDDSDMAKAIDTAVRAMRLLRDQEPRVMTLDEVSRIQVETDVWIETHHPIYGCHIKAATAYATSNGDGNYLYVLGNPQSWHNYRFVDYEKNWRCWTARPSEERRIETPWEN